jgi:hypothetical protein
MLNEHLGGIIERRLKDLNKSQRWLGMQMDPPVSDNAVSLWISTGKISSRNYNQLVKILGLVGVAQDNEGQLLQLHYLTPAEFHIIDTYRQTTKVGRSLMDAAVMSARAHIPQN